MMHVCNRNLKISKALLKSQAHQGTSLFTSAATNQREGFLKGDHEKLRSDFQNTRRGRTGLYTYWTPLISIANTKNERRKKSLISLHVRT